VVARRSRRRAGGACRRVVPADRPDAERHPGLKLQLEPEVIGILPERNLNNGQPSLRAALIAASVQRIWRAHKLQPHRLRTFKRSSDSGFAAKLTDIVGLYIDLPAHAVVLSLEEKSQIQALDRTQPGLPIKPGRCQTMTHDYKRHGTTTRFAALSVLDST
jgi:hypothetical protein